MKKSNLVIIGTLAAGLLLAGCDHGSSPSPLTGQSNPGGAKALKAALGQPDDVIAFDEASATLTVLQDLTIGVAQPSPSVQSLSQAASDYQSAALFAAAYAPVQNGELEIPYGVTFKVAAAVTVTVSGGATVIVAAGNESYKPAEITFAPKGDADAGGSVTVESGGVIDARGAITVPEDAKLEAKGTVKMTTSAVLEAAGTVEVPSGGKLEGTGAVKVAGTGALTAAGEVKVAALTTAGTVTVPEGGKLEATGTVKVESTATLEVKGTVTAAEVTVQGTVTVAEGAGLATTQGTVTVENGGSLDAKGDVTVPEGEKITAENGAKISGIDGDEIDAQGGAAVEKKYSASSVDGLATAIASAKAAATGSVTGVVQLTEAFYTDANSKTAALVIDAGETDNATHYIVRGLGIGSGKPALSVGVLLANDNVTLEDVKIELTDPTKAAKFTGSPRYTAGVMIARATDATPTLATGENRANKNVTVKDASISYTRSSADSGYLHPAGIYVDAEYGYPATNITISNNIVILQSFQGYAGQALIIGSYSPLVTITGNTLTASNTHVQAVNAPSSALFMNIHPKDVIASNTPVISGNTLTGGNTDFMVNILSTGDFVGIPTLFADKFGSPDTVWATNAATDNGSFYRKLQIALIAQSKSNGYGLFFMCLGSDAGSFDGYKFAMEAWEFDTGKVTAVDYWGPKIQSNADVYDADGKDIDAGVGTGNDTSHGARAGYRGRITIGANGAKSGTGTFHWSRNDTTGTNYPTP